jgi:two-component system LytT family sensor kinase
MGIYYFSAVAFLATTAGFVGLGIAVYRRAKRSAEVKVLLLMLLCFSLQSLLLSLDALFFGMLRTIPDKAHELLMAAASSLQLLTLAAVFHFTFLTYSRALDEGGLLNDPFSRLRDYKGQYWFWVCFIYSVPAAGIVRYAYRAFTAWQAHPSGGWQLPAMPSLESSGGFLAFFWFLWTLRVVAVLQQRRSSPNKITAIEWILVPLRTYPEHHNVLRLGDYQSPVHDRKATPVSKDEWMTSLLLSLWMLLFMGFAIWAQGGAPDSDQVSGVLWLLLPSVFLVPLVYYKMRFVFFDVLIKRGLIAILLLVSSALLCGLLLVPAYGRLASRSTAAAPLMLFSGMTLFVGAWLALYGGLNRMLDRYLFRRADYGSVVAEIDEAMKQFVDPGQLLEEVRNRLRSAINAESVEFIPLEPSQAASAPREKVHTAGTPQRQLATAEIPVSAAGRVFGIMKFGKRTGGFRYQSEDLAFMTAVAGRLAEMLHNFELRSEREAQQRREEQLRSLAEQSELRALRAQINPHFLFNALNSLADLTQEDPQAAEAVILHLSHIFRYALDASRRENVSLEEELGFVESYLAVERLRYEDRLRHEIVASAEARRCWLPPMLIQPIVENAVKHGISCKMGGGTVTIRAAVEEQKLRIEIADDGIGFDIHSVDGPGRQGVGLKNVRSRLEHVAGLGSLQVDSTPGGGTRVSLKIPVQKGEDPR